MFRTLMLLCSLVPLSACPEPEPEPDPTPEPLTQTQVDGVLLDSDTEQPLAGCEVGVQRAGAVLSGEDGSFSLVVDLGSILHVLCPEAPLHSFEVPEVAEIDWEFEIDRGTGQDPATSCFPSMHMDASALPEGNGGTLELRILNATDTASQVTPFYREVTLANVFLVPAGDYRLYARASGGTTGGFGASALQTCAGDASATQVEVTVQPVTTRELLGTWSGASAGASFAMNAYQYLDDPDFGWWSQAIAHTSSGNPNGWSVTVADGIGIGPIDLEACQTAADSTACVNRLAVDEGGTIAIGALATPASAIATLVAGQRLSVNLPIELGSGRMTVRLDDWTNPNEPEVLWRATSWSPSVAVPLEWLEDLPPAGSLRARVFALGGVTFDLPAGYEPTGWPDGWTSWAPALAEVLGG